MAYWKIRIWGWCWGVKQEVNGALTFYEWLATYSILWVLYLDTLFYWVVVNRAPVDRMWSSVRFSATCTKPSASVTFVNPFDFHIYHFFRQSHPPRRWRTVSFRNSKVSWFVMLSLVHVTSVRLTNVVQAILNHPYYRQRFVKVYVSLHAPY